MMVTKIRTGDSAVIFYGDDEMPGTVSRIITSRTGNLRRVGITPDGTDVVAWFTPSAGYASTPPLLSVGGETVAYV
jgi:hypothetical protein